MGVKLGLLLPVLLCAAASAVDGTKRTLAVLAGKGIKTSHAQFFADLKDRGHNITFTTVKKSNSVYSYGERAYDNLVLFAPEADSLDEGLTLESVLSFLDDGGNIFVAASAQPGAAVQEIARAVGFVTAATDATLIDFFNTDKTDDGSGTTIVVDSSSGHSVAIGASVMGPLLYSGTGFRQGRFQLSFPMLSASTSAYLGQPWQPAPAQPIAVGSDVVLVGGMQARNSARMVVVGGMDMLSDKYAEATVKTADGKSVASANRALAREISMWAFREKSILHVANVSVNAINPKAPGMLTVMDDVEYEIYLEELQNGEWVAFEGQQDVQLQYTCMEPYVITTLAPGSNGKYSTRLTLPDVYGLFTFKVVYAKPGYTVISEDHVEVIRPLRNTMHSRFIFGAYPYYVSAFSMMVGVYLLCFVFLYHKDSPAKAKTD